MDVSYELERRPHHRNPIKMLRCLKYPTSLMDNYTQQWHKLSQTMRPYNRFGLISRSIVYIVHCILSQILGCDT